MALVYPSLFEGFGIPLVEAMSASFVVAGAITTRQQSAGADP